MECEEKKSAQACKTKPRHLKIPKPPAERVRDYALVLGDGKISQEIADVSLDKMEIDKLGLDSNDIRILKTIIRNYGGGPVGVETLAAAVGEETVTIEDVCEPYLMQIGFGTPPRGRCVTPLAYDHLGLARPMGDPDATPF